MFFRFEDESPCTLSENQGVSMAQTISHLRMNAQIDQILDGYRLIRFLGRGGFGEVWLCRSEAMGDYRALKIIPSTSASHLQKEYDALLHYRKAASSLRSPHLLLVEHVNLTDVGLFYVMPLADGSGADDPADLAWVPTTLGRKIHEKKDSASWFASGEIIAIMAPVLGALQTLSDAGLIHRDVKPDNILFFDGKPCLGDVSLLGRDAEMITHRGTPGYTTPSWYIGGQPDMYGAAATLYHLLTGNLPDKMGRSSFLWPPQGEKSLTTKEIVEWMRLHKVIRRACEEKTAERYLDFSAMAKNLAPSPPEVKKLPRILLATCSLIGIAAATVVAVFREKQSDWSSRDSKATDQANTQLPELTEEQKNDYRILVGLSEAYLKEKNYSNALATIESLLSTYPQARTQPQYSITRAAALIGLDRREEAIKELKSDVHLSPNIAAASIRQGLWFSLQEWQEAENDLSRILRKFGPNTILLYHRAESRILQDKMGAAREDQKRALAIKPNDPQQIDLVTQLWKPLEAKYPAYAHYCKSTATDPWIIQNWDAITQEITAIDPQISPDAQRGRVGMAKMMKDHFQQGNYHSALLVFERITESLPFLSERPLLSLFRAVLYQRLNQPEKLKAELARHCHQEAKFEQLDIRVPLLDILGQAAEAEKLCTKVIASIDLANPLSNEISFRPWHLRALARAAQSNFAGIEEDRITALGIAEKSSDPKSLRADIATTWLSIESSYPGYAEYRKNLPEK
jgi:serine/threonine protein kinase